MRGRPLLVQAGVAAGALAVAAVVWLRPPPQGSPGEVPVAKLVRGDVKAVHWDDGSHRVDVWRGPEPDRTTWVRIGTSPSLVAPDAGSARDAGAAIDGGVSGPGARADAGVRARGDGGVSDVLRAIREAPPPPDRNLRGNETAEQLLDRASPPMATRDLGIASAERRTDLGLEASSKRLQLDTRPGAGAGTVLGSTSIPGVVFPFVVSTPPGASGAYLLAPDGQLWLIHESLVQDLSAASSRLVDRRLHAFRSDEPDALQLQLDGRTRSFVVRKAQGSTRVAPAEDPDAPSPEATAWADRVWKLAPLEVLGAGETPREGTPVSTLRVEYLRARKTLGFLELARAGNDWFARTEHTAGWVRLPPQTSTVREQADRLEGGVPAPR
ncbi:MAG: hypothetical protein ACXWK5_04650 [Myxococcaceae bacterium]